MKRARTHQRLCFAGTLHGGILRTRGCKTTIVDGEGEYLREIWEASKVAWLNLGDLVIVSNARLESDEVAMAEVVAMKPNGAPIIAMKIASVSDGAVHVMKVARR